MNRDTLAASGSAMQLCQPLVTRETYLTSLPYQEEDLAIMSDPEAPSSENE